MSGLPRVSPYLLQAPKPRPNWLPGDRLVWDAFVVAVDWADGWVYTVVTKPPCLAQGAVLEQQHRFRLAPPVNDLT